MAQYSSSATRIGNWVEEAAAQEAAALDKLHLDSAASPLSRAQRGERSVAAGRTRVPLTSASEDGFVRFGDRVVLQSEVVPGCMAACPESVGDPLGEQPATQACCASLAALHGAHDGCAAARCVLLLERCGKTVPSSVSPPFGRLRH